MIALVIIGVLATLSAYGVRKYIASSKTGEAIQMIGSIKAAQEAFKDETFAYLDVTGSLDTYYPANPTPGQAKMSWTGTGGSAWSNFRTLGVTASGPVLFVYACTSGTAAETPDSPGSDITVGNWPSAAHGEPWYVVKAKADLAKGGHSTVYVASNFTSQIFSANEGE
jgi:type IV pilus assembly protein PilA